MPQCATADAPLVVDMHPFLECPSTLADYSGWLQLATSECFVVLWPIGNTDPDLTPGLCWAVPAGNKGLDASDPDKETNSCCCVDFGAEDPLNPLDPEEIGDLEFVRESAVRAVDAVANESNGVVSIDPRRIYVTGHSNGCYASFGMAMRHSDFVAGTACMAGLWVTPPALDYSPVPMWVVNGDKDLVAPVVGFDLFGAFVPSTAVSFENLSSLNGCNGGVEESSVRVPAMDLLISQGRLSSRKALGCTGGATVEFVRLSTAGHIPYQGAPEAFPPPPLASVTSVDTTLLAWNFLASFSRDNIPPEFVITRDPTRRPTMRPTSSPSNTPTRRPTARPTDEPSLQPTSRPTNRPTSGPSTMPTEISTSGPVQVSFTSLPSSVSSPMPSNQAVEPTDQPSVSPVQAVNTQPPTSPPTGPTNEGGVTNESGLESDSQVGSSGTAVSIRDTLLCLLLTPLLVLQQ